MRASASEMVWCDRELLLDVLEALVDVRRFLGRLCDVGLDLLCLLALVVDRLRTCESAERRRARDGDCDDERDSEATGVTPGGGGRRHGSE
jgi:hypothetical protein